MAGKCGARWRNWWHPGTGVCECFRNEGHTWDCICECDASTPIPLGKRAATKTMEATAA